MKAEFWHERWKLNQIGFHQDEFNNHLQAFWSKLSVPTGSRIFVPLCGKSRDMLWLRAQDFLVTGVELSPIAVSNFFTENDLNVTITQQGKLERWESDGLSILLGDFFDMTAEDVTDCAAVFDRASLIALPPEMRPRYAEHFKSILPADIQSLLVTLEYDQLEMNGPPFSVHEEEVRHYYEEAFEVECLFNANVLDESPGFRQRGLTRLDEKVYKLS